MRELVHLLSGAHLSSRQGAGVTVHGKHEAVRRAETLNGTYTRWSGSMAAKDLHVALTAFQLTTIQNMGMIFTCVKNYNLITLHVLHLQLRYLYSTIIYNYYVAIN